MVTGKREVSNRLEDPGNYWVTTRNEVKNIRELVGLWVDGHRSSGAWGALPMPGYQGFDVHLVVSHVWYLGETGAITVPVDSDVSAHHCALARPALPCCCCAQKNWLVKKLVTVTGCFQKRSGS